MSSIDTNRIFINQQTASRFMSGVVNDFRYWGGSLDVGFMTESDADTGGKFMFTSHSLHKYFIWAKSVPPAYVEERKKKIPFVDSIFLTPNTQFSKPYHYEIHPYGLHGSRISVTDPIMMRMAFPEKISKIEIIKEYGSDDNGKKFEEHSIKFTLEDLGNGKLAFDVPLSITNLKNSTIGTAYIESRSVPAEINAIFAFVNSIIGQNGKMADYVRNLCNKIRTLTKDEIESYLV